MKRYSDNAEDLQAKAAVLVRSLTPGEQATVVTLSGDLGAGKTTFAQGMARALGVTETVSSPTFVLEKIYALADKPFTHLIHIDAYRLKDDSELGAIGWHEIIANPGNLIVLEWPERVQASIPRDATPVRFDIEGERRIITMNYGEESST